MATSVKIPEPEVKCIKYTTRNHLPVGDKQTDFSGCCLFGELSGILTDHYQQYWVLISNVLAGEIGVAILFRSIDTVPQAFRQEWINTQVAEIDVDPNRSTRWPNTADRPSG